MRRCLDLHEYLSDSPLELVQIMIQFAENLAFGKKMNMLSIVELRDGGPDRRLMNPSSSHRLNHSSLPEEPVVNAGMGGLAGVEEVRSG